jgi:hypothetical protein
MRLFVRMVICLLIALAAGCAFYTLAAIIWTVVDPQVAAASLLFTIPQAIVGTAIPALLAVVLLLTRQFA